MIYNNENEILAKGAIFRANSGFWFLEECLTYIHRGGTDVAFSRSLYILFSYNFELILKARILLESRQTRRDDLIKEIKSHDLEELSKRLSKNALNGLDIKNIRRGESSGFTEYVIEMFSGDKIVLQDLVDVRYDFVKNSLRKFDPEESNKMKNEAKIMISMTKKIMKLLKL